MEKIQSKYKYAVIATDVAIFTVQDNELKVLLMKMKKKPFLGMWALPGGLVQPNESIDDAAVRVLKEKTSVKGVYLEQFSTFGQVDRDPFGRVVSVAYFALVPSETLRITTDKESENVNWFPINSVPGLAYDHHAMLDIALKQLKNRLEYSNIAFSLLPPKFTLTELQRVYEIILGRSIDKRNFRKRILQNSLLKSTGKKREGVTNRPAELYRFASRNSQTVKVL